jgi:hypothetical protein
MEMTVTRKAGLSTIFTPGFAASSFGSCVMPMEASTTRCASPRSSRSCWVPAAGTTRWMTWAAWLPDHPRQ